MSCFAFLAIILTLRCFMKPLDILPENDVSCPSKQGHLNVNRDSWEGSDLHNNETHTNQNQLPNIVTLTRIIFLCPGLTKKIFDDLRKSLGTIKLRKNKKIINFFFYQQFVFIVRNTM